MPVTQAMRSVQGLVNDANGDCVTGFTKDAEPGCQRCLRCLIDDANDANDANDAGDADGCGLKQAAGSDD